MRACHCCIFCVIRAMLMQNFLGSKTWQYKERVFLMHIHPTPKSVNLSARRVLLAPARERSVGISRLALTAGWNFNCFCVRLFDLDFERAATAAACKAKAAEATELHYN
jgi:hypothetical protein